MADQHFPFGEERFKECQLFELHYPSLEFKNSKNSEDAFLK